jgi:hypothetical protein
VSVKVVVSLPGSVDTQEEVRRSTMEGKKAQRGEWRTYTPEFKADAVKLVLDEGRPFTQVARELNLIQCAGVIGTQG